MYAILSKRFRHYQKTWTSPSFMPKLQTIHYWHQMSLSKSNVNVLRIIFECLLGFILGSELRAESIGIHSIHFRKMAAFLIGYELFNKWKLKVLTLMNS